MEFKEEAVRVVENIIVPVVVVEVVVEVVVASEVVVMVVAEVVVIIVFGEVKVVGTLDMMVLVADSRQDNLIKIKL